MKITILIGGHRSIELPLSDEELNFQMRQMGIRETIPKGKLVKVSEKDNPLQKLEGQFLNMDEVNFFARRMEHLTEYERKVLEAYANNCGVSTMKDLINLTFSMKGLSLLTDFSDASQVGVRLYTDEFSEIPEEQMDFTEFAKNALKESNVKVLPYGVLVDHGFELLEVYNGKTFPKFIVSEETVAVVEVQNTTGDREYLYLPTDICSMDKVKEQVVEERDVKFETNYNNNATLPKGEEVVTQEGVLGKDNVTVVKTYENGTFVEEIILSKENLVKPIPKLIDLGTSEFLAKHKVHLGDTMYLATTTKLKESADDSSKDVAEIKESLDVKLLELPSEEWCKVSFDNVEGYLKTSSLTSSYTTPNIIEKNIYRYLIRYKQNIPKQLFSILQHGKEI